MGSALDRPSGPRPWEETTAQRRRRRASELAEASHPGSAVSRWLTPVKNCICEAGIIEKGPPLVINSSHFQDEKAGLEPVQADISDDEWDHMIAQVAYQEGQVRRSTHTGGIRGLNKRSRKEKAKAIGRKALKRGKHDHEASFDAEVHLDETGKHSSLTRLIIKHAPLHEFKVILAHRPDEVRETDQFWQTPLFWAAGTRGRDALDYVELLIDARSSLDARNKFGYTPLMRAIRHGHLAIAKLLVDRRASLNIMDKFGSSCVYVAASVGHAHCLKWLLTFEDCRSHISVGDCDGCTPLIAACRRGHREVCLDLLKASADANEVDIEGRSVLLFAFAQNNHRLAHILLEHEANLFVKDCQGRCIASSLVDNMGKYLHFRNPTLCGLVTALEARAELDEQDEDGCTPVMLAAKMNVPSAASVLAIYRADLSIEDENGKTPFQVAKAMTHVDVMSVLRDFGGFASTHVVSLNRALLRATFYGNSDAVAVLVDRGAKVATTASRKGRHVVDIARRVGLPHLLKILVDAEQNEQSEQSELIHSHPFASKGDDVEGMIPSKSSDSLHSQQDTLKHSDRPSTSSGGDTSGFDNSTLECWRRMLSDADRVWGEISRAAFEQNPDAIAKSATILLEMELGRGVDGHISFNLLADHLAFRKESALKMAKVEVRRFRSKARIEFLRQFHKDLNDWYHEATVDVAALHVLANRADKLQDSSVYDFEAGDAHTTIIEQFQIKHGAVAFRLFLEIISAVGMETQLRSAIPSDSPINAVAELECIKCTLKFGTQAVLDSHLMVCDGMLGLQRHSKLKDARLDQVYAAIHDLETTVKMYRKREDHFLAAVRHAKHDAAIASKKAPESVPFLMEVQDLLEFGARIVLSRIHATEEFCKATYDRFGKWAAEQDAFVRSYMPKRRPSNLSVARDDVRRNSKASIATSEALPITNRQTRRVSIATDGVLPSPHRRTSRASTATSDTSPTQRLGIEDTAARGRDGSPREASPPKRRLSKENAAAGSGSVRDGSPKRRLSKENTASGDRSPMPSPRHTVANIAGRNESLSPRSRRRSAP